MSLGELAGNYTVKLYSISVNMLLFVYGQGFRRLGDFTTVRSGG